MSAVSSGSPQDNAEVREPEGSHQPGSSQSPSNFGANEWLVEELYQRYLADPASVDRAWWSFFADYTPTLPNGTGPQPVITATPPSRAPAPSQNLASAPPQVPQPPAAPPAQAAAAPAQQAALAPAPATQPAPGQAPAPAASAPAPAAPAAPAQAAPAQAAAAELAPTMNQATAGR